MCVAPAAFGCGTHRLSALVLAASLASALPAPALAVKPASKLPGVSVQHLEVQGVTVPRLSVPGVTVASIEVQGVTVPKMSVQGVTVPHMSVPGVTRQRLSVDGPPKSVITSRPGAEPAMGSGSYRSTRPTWQLPGEMTVAPVEAAKPLEYPRRAIDISAPPAGASSEAEKAVTVAPVFEPRKLEYPRRPISFVVERNAARATETEDSEEFITPEDPAQ